MELLFGEQTYGLTVSILSKGQRSIVNARPLPTRVIDHSCPESLLPRHNTQLLFTEATIATYIFNSSSLIGNIYVSDKALHVNLSNPCHHAHGFCARDETPLYQCYW